MGEKYIRHTLRVYVIENKAVPGVYWSNDNGWVTLDSAQLYVFQDVNLPLDGRWIALDAEEELCLIE